MIVELSIRISNLFCCSNLLILVVIKYDAVCSCVLGVTIVTLQVVIVRDHAWMQFYEQEIYFFLRTFQFHQDEIFKDERDFSGQKHLHLFYLLATSIQETSFILK